MITSRRIKWEGHVAHMEQKKSAYEVLVETSEGKRQTVGSKYEYRWEDDIKMYLKVVECEDVDWILLAQNRKKCRALVNTALNFQVH
jgi:hypothetical protein